MSNERINLPEAEAWRLYGLLGELVRFLHQSGNYQSPDQVERWLASGVYSEISDLFYRTAYDWFPVDDETDRVEPPAGSNVSSSPRETHPTTLRS